jgi:hypothetical protein
MNVTSSDFLSIMFTLGIELNTPSVVSNLCSSKAFSVGISTEENKAIKPSTSTSFSGVSSTTSGIF